MQPRRMAFAVFFVALVLFGNLSAFCSDWVLAASPFEFLGGQDTSASQKELSQEIPALILEQVLQEAKRRPTKEELLLRRLDALQTERVSLFLQLSREIRARDTLVISEEKPRKIKKRIKEAEKKIALLEDKIRENLSNSDAALSGEDASLQNAQSEAIKLYKSEAAALFIPPENALDGTREYERLVTQSGINGLITGSLRQYGGYVSVTCAVSLFPGNAELCTVTEVGSIENCVQLAGNIARVLLPKIQNELPVTLEFEITPEQSVPLVRIAVDGTLVQLKDATMLLPAGTHTITVGAEGFVGKSVTYAFTGGERFHIYIPLERVKSGDFSLSLRTEQEGLLYANGGFIGAVPPYTHSITIDGNPVIGEFRVLGQNGAESLSDFFYIPANIQEHNAGYSVAVNARNTAELIDKRRIWMYRSYTLFMLTLPLTFYTMGKYNTAYNAFFNGYVPASEVNGLNRLRFASAGLSIVTGCIFIFELVRYLHTASSVLPSVAKYTGIQELSSEAQTAVVAQDSEEAH